MEKLCLWGWFVGKSSMYSGNEYSELLWLNEWGPSCLYGAEVDYHLCSQMFAAPCSITPEHQRQFQSQLSLTLLTSSLEALPVQSTSRSRTFGILRLKRYTVCPSISVSLLWECSPSYFLGSLTANESTSAFFPFKIQYYLDVSILHASKVQQGIRLQRH